MKRILMVMMVLLLAAGTVFAQSDLQSVAIVRLTRSEPITVKQLRTEVEKMEQSGGRTLTATERRQVLDVMINERLAIQAAERDRVTISDAEVNNQLQQMRASMSQSLGRQPTDQEFEIAVLQETGSDVATFTASLRKQMLIQKYLMEKKRSIFDAMKAPTEAEITNFYNLNKAQLVRPDTVRISLVSVPFTNAAEKTAAKTLTDRLLRDIGSDAAKFDETEIRSQTPNSGYQGGDIGYIPRSAEVQEAFGADFVNTAFSLKQGEISKIIETPNAYLIIKVTESYTFKLLELTDLAQLGSNVTVHDYIGNILLQQIQQNTVNAASQELITELRQGNSFQVFDNLINW